ncbi:hypothetical protein SAMD00019534_110130 [Acytostelium subglobosum LB1]|uniref:hypothetical protein n=1 Tax=Acytostelium subglobosum LB1 TaxID=1410327 RepID=UPI000644F3EB|nr:hypothetical protein SAMD00019534_110130 [Acytostelium subglobosum LB1]GAM27837.1 hypothetical protein SAMD00019534_110130 [Acytostelium subglobosum LB1]|eukprot:XP_012749120.1 hypothetical protein SAMD00019534_110130 [Acytostelium subglobosum LB1]
MLSTLWNRSIVRYGDKQRQLLKLMPKHRHLVSQFNVVPLAKGLNISPTSMFTVANNNSNFLLSSDNRHLGVLKYSSQSSSSSSSSSKDQPKTEEQHTTFVIQGPPPQRPPPQDKIDWRLTGEGRTFSNAILFSIGLAISLAALGSLVLSQSDEDRNRTDKQSKYRYFRKMLSYYWWAPPIGLWINNGELDEIINDFKAGQLTDEGILLLYQISGFRAGRQILSQRGVVETICERVDSYFEAPEPGSESDQMVLRYQPSTTLALELSLLVNLTVFNGQKVSEETKQKILQLKKILNPGQQRPFDNDFLVEKSQLLGRVQEVYESPVGFVGLLVFAVGGAFTAFALLRKQPQWVRQIGMRNSGVACAMVASLHYYRNMSYDKFISTSQSYNSYVAKVELSSLIFSTGLIMVAGLPYLFWIVPCTAMYFGHILYQSVKVINMVKKDVEQSKLIKKSNSPFDD